MKYTLLIITALMLIVGCSESDAQQKVITVTETYNDGDVSKISYHKITGNKIELVKEINWHENGQKLKEGTYKDGKEDGLWTEWYKNGQKGYEGIFKDGEFDGKWTYWHENGQKWQEGTWKDGSLISSKCWDVVGYEIDCSELY